MFIHDVLFKDASLTCCDRSQIELQLYLVDRPRTRYDLKLFQFFESNGSYVFGTGSTEMSSLVVETDYKN